MTWTIQPKHRMTRHSDPPGQAFGQALPADVIAAACILDPRFSAATTQESTESIAELLETEAFSVVLKRIGSTNVPAHLATVVSAVYACRVEEKRLPKRPAKMR